MAPQAFDCTDYLDRVLPALLQHATVPAPGAEAILQFVVTDVPSCELHYCVTAAGLEVRRGVAARPDLTVALSSAALHALSENRLDVGPALASARVRVHGDTRYLRWLAQRLES